MQRNGMDVPTKIRFVTISRAVNLVRAIIVIIMAFLQLRLPPCSLLFFSRLFACSYHSSVLRFDSRRTCVDHECVRKCFPAVIKIETNPNALRREMDYGREGGEWIMGNIQRGRGRVGERSRKITDTG